MFCKRLCKAIGESFQHNAIVVVVSLFILCGQGINAVSRGHAESADIVIYTAVIRCYEICQAGVRLALLRSLLAQLMQSAQRFAAGFIGVDRNVIGVTACREALHGGRPASRLARAPDASNRRS